MFRSKIISFGILIVGILLISEQSAHSAFIPSQKKDLIEKKYGDLKKYNFAGESFPFYLDHHQRRYEQYENLITRSNIETAFMIRRSKQVFQIIEPILKFYGIPDDFKYLAVAESNLNRKVVSQASAVGIWQLMSVTAQYYNLQVNTEIDERLNLIKSTEAICKLLRDDKKYFGTWTEALVSFNMGAAALSKFQSVQNNHDNIYSLRMYKESAHVIYKILAYKHLFENLEKYGYGNLNKEKIKIVPHLVRQTIENVDLFAKSKGCNISNFRYYNSWILGNKLTIDSKNKSYIVNLVY